MLKKKQSIRIRREQLDTLFSGLKKHIFPSPPKKGWIREIRESLGMKRPTLAKRLFLDPSTIARLEQSEAKKTITLQSLERLAEALECDLSYVLVPRRPLSKILEERAKKVIKKEEEAIEHTMALEGQGVVKKKGVVRQAIEIAILIESNDKRLWEEDSE